MLKKADWPKSSSSFMLLKKSADKTSVIMTGRAIKSYQPDFVFMLLLILSYYVDMQ